MTPTVAETALPRLQQDLGDDILVTRVQSGDENAFRLLVDRHGERVRNLIHSVFHAPDLVDDLAQEVFLKAWRALPTFRFDASFYTWLYRITINHCRDEMRKRSLRSMFSLQRLLDNGDKEVLKTLRVEPTDGELREVIQRGLRKLPERYRIPVVLKDMEGCSYEEIADIMRCEIGTVKSRLSRGRAMLREHLAPYIEHD